MSKRQFWYLLTMVVIAGTTASAQATTRPRTDMMTTVTPKLATATFAPLSLGGKFNGTSVLISLYWVSASPGAPALMRWDKESGISLQTPGGIANGNYSVAFTISQSNGAATLSLKRGADEIAQCPIQSQLSYTGPIQTCESGPISVVDGKLELSLGFVFRQIPPSTAVNVSQIAISQVR